MRMRNLAPANNVLLRTAIDEIQSCLPAHWSTSVAVKTNDASDARLVIKTPAGANAAVAIASRRQLDPSLVAGGGRRAQGGRRRRVPGHLALSRGAHARAPAGARDRLRRPGGQRAPGARSPQHPHRSAGTGTKPLGQGPRRALSRRTQGQPPGPRAVRRGAPVRRAAARGTRRHRPRLRLAPAGVAGARGADPARPARPGRAGRRPGPDPPLGDRISLPRRESRGAVPRHRRPARAAVPFARSRDPLRRHRARQRRPAGASCAARTWSPATSTTPNAPPASSTCRRSETAPTSSCWSRSTRWFSATPGNATA